MAHDSDMTTEGTRPLSSLEGYEVAEGSVDIRGFTVEDSTGVAVGEVSDLLVDTSRETVRFVVVRLMPAGDRARQELGTVRVPIEAVSVDERARRIRVERLGPVDDTQADAPRAEPEGARGGLVIAPGEGGDVISRSHR